MTYSFFKLSAARFHLGAFALATGLGLAISAADAQQRGPNSVADLAEVLTPAVVNISTSQNVAGAQSIPVPEVPEGSPFKDFFEEFFDRQRRGDRPRRVQSLGSGFVIDAEGIVVTNNHVIADADEIEVNFADGTNLEAELIGRDTKTDLAVLRIKPSSPLKAVNFGDSDALRVGDWVMAVGNPFGLGGSVSIGIVSARNRNINAGPYDNFIQTDAAINRGNSGGPLFNMDGEVVGINTAIFSPTGGSVGIGFSVPANTAKLVIDQLIQFGETRRGWIGVRIQEVTDDIADSLGMTQARGALVSGANEDGPAGKAGVLAGDVILKFDGHDVPKMGDLPRVVADTPPEKEVDVVVLRNGKEMTLRVTVGRLEENEQVAQATTEDEPKDEESVPTLDTKILGVELSEITPELRSRYKIDDKVEGVVVTSVEPDSAMADKGIEPGMVIVEFGQEEVRKPADVAKGLEKLKAQGRKSALVLLATGSGELRFIAVRIPD